MANVVEAVTVAGSAAAAGGAAAAAVGLPPKLVLISAVIGAAIAVWGQTQKDFEFSAKWAAGAVALFGAYVAFGVFGAVLVAAVGPKVWAPIAEAPTWALAGALSSMASFLLPLARRWAEKRAEKNADA